MKLGSLTEHPDWPMLLESVKNQVDKEAELVVEAAATKEERQVRIAAGRYASLRDLFRELGKVGRST